MLYNYYFDVAALISSVFLLTVYILRKSLRTKSNVLLFVLINVCALGSLFDIISCFSISFPRQYSMVYNNFVCLGYLFLYNAMGVLFLAYIDSKTKIPKIRNAVNIYVNTILVIEALLIFTSPLTHMVAYFDDKSNYCHGPALYFLYAMAALHLLAAAVMFVIMRRRFNKYQVMAVVAFIVVVTLGVLIQAIWPSLLVGQFGCALVLFFIYTSLENPVYFTYRGTTCFNRRAFFEIMKMKLREKENFGIFAISIKDFENYMAALSYKNIGRLSSAIAEWLYSCYRENVFVVADDMFAIILKENMNPDSLRDRITEHFNNPINLVDNEVNVKVNMVYIPHIDTTKKADMIESGLRYVLSRNLGAKRDFDFNEVISKIERRRNISKMLKHAIEEDLFDIYFQPIRSVHTGKYTSAEALVRLKSMEYGYISPEEFIPIAETDGLIVQIGEIVFEKVCKFINEYKVTTALGVRYIEINLSPIQCAQPDIVRKFRDIMDKYNIVPFWINLEITETASFEDSEMMLRNINSFHNMGVSFSLDDYGSGFASADYLFRVPAEIVKIDKNILWQGMKEVNAGIVLIGTLSLLKSLGKKIVVEGVENQAMVDLLVDNGCDYMQGYFYSRPIPPIEYVDFLKANN